MPVKVKKNKKVIKQKQKQSQKQVVNIKIGEIKKAAARRRAVNKKSPAKSLVQQSVQPVQYLYQSTGSAPASQNIGVTEPQAKANLLGEQPLSAEVQKEIQRVGAAVKSAERQLEIGSSSLARENILGGARIQPEDIRRQRELTLSKPVESSIFPSEEASVTEPTSVRYSGIFPSASSFEGDNPMLAGGSVSAFEDQPFSQLTDIPTGRTPRLYKNRQTLIREILRATDRFTATELKEKNTMEIRKIYDTFY